MQFLEDPSEMTAEQRLTEIAMILASGVRRMNHFSMAVTYAWLATMHRPGKAVFLTESPV